MKTLKTLFNFFLLSVFAIAFQSCLKDKYHDIPTIKKPKTIVKSNNNGFEFNTVKEFDVTINAKNNNTPLNGVYIELFISNPLNKDGLLKRDCNKHKVFQGITNNGILKCKINPPTQAEKLYVLTYYVGLPPLTIVSLFGEDININIANKTSVNRTKRSSHKGTNTPVPNQVNGYYVLGDWDSYGVPNYLENTNDVISNDFLDDVNASLPEREALPVSHPQYLASSDDASLVLLEDCEAWVTFVHEGAGWHNTLGYYTYPTNNPPTSVSDITNRTIIFPDVSKHSNGLVSGNKIQLYYLDASTNSFTSVFPAGISIGWFLIAQGWSSSSQSIGNGSYIHYSNVDLNVESSSELNKHNVLLFDNIRELLLLGFEDIRRDNSGCDNDFNDAVFYTTVSPVTAVDLSMYQPIDNPIDSDNDGVSDVFDQYPNDPNLAFGNYYPSESTFGTLVFEDLWPYKGDYDFNDLVVDYNFNQITNSQNNVTEISAKFIVRAIGASYHNAFGVSLNTSPSNVSSVTGQLNSKGYIDIASNGTENGQSKAVIIIFDDAYNALPYPGTGLCVNTYEESPYVTPDTIEIHIEFINPILFANIGTPPYNPFIIIDKNRGMEVHLPNLPPTDLANLDSLGIGDDDSDINAGKYYVSDVYLPWAINLPVSFDYPSEKNNITATHTVFNNWATSQGYNYMDWYQEKIGYRNYSKIYSK